jgi:hypothetical protein
MSAMAQNMIMISTKTRVIPIWKNAKEGDAIEKVWRQILEGVQGLWRNKQFVSWSAGRFVRFIMRTRRSNAEEI